LAEGNKSWHALTGFPSGFLTGRFTDSSRRNDQVNAKPDHHQPTDQLKPASFLFLKSVLTQSDDAYRKNNHVIEHISQIVKQ
ncbi:MAG: hypothetical protein ACXV79_06595, partial [Methylobacter sp.]